MSFRHPHLIAAALVCSLPGLSHATTTYLNIDNISVSVGDGTSEGTFNNTFDNGNTIDKVIDAPSAEAEETHNQTTHIWFTAAAEGGGLELVFDLDREYDITTLHFWNYTGEGFDVDQIDFTFFDSADNSVGTLSVEPELGSSGGIVAQDIPLASPLNVRYVKAFLIGSNREIDFQNIGFTADQSLPVLPEQWILHSDGQPYDLEIIQTGTDITGTISCSDCGQDPTTISGTVDRDGNVSFQRDLSPAGTADNDEVYSGHISTQQNPRTGGFDMAGVFQVTATGANAGWYAVLNTDIDGDAIPNTVETAEGTDPGVRDNQVFVNNRLYVMQLYRDLLRREGDSGGVAFWTGVLDDIGTEQGLRELIIFFLNSQEYAARFTP